MLLLAIAPFIGFGESEGAVATAEVNSPYWLVWRLLVSRLPSLTGDWKNQVAV